MTDDIETVLFDLDGTLCQYERSSGELLEIAFQRVGVEPFFDQATYYERFERFVDESDRMADLRRRCFVDIARERDRDPAVGAALADAFAAERDHARVGFVDGADTLLTRLHDRGYRLGLVTNGHAEMQRAKLASLGIADAFGTAVFAGSDTRSKPHPEPFERALSALDADPARTLFVGDSLESDVAGAGNLGLWTAWVAGDSTAPAPDGETARPDHVLDTTGDLLAVL